MVHPALDPCIGPLAHLCEAPAQVVGSAASGASNYVLGGLGGAFVEAAELLSVGALNALDTLTPIDLTVSWLRANLAVIATITLPVVVALFAVQVATSVLRREPGGLARAVVGVAQALVGSALAIAITQLALTAVDELCGYIAQSAGTSVSASASRFFSFSQPALTANPGLAILFGIAMMIGFLLLWGVLLFRKAALILIVVLAPIAFAGSVWDQTRVWTRRWLEIVAALVFSKLVIVIVFVVGASAFGGVGPEAGTADVTGVADTAALSDVLVGLLLLSIAVFAPWLTWRFVHWSGMEAAAVMNSAVAANPLTRGIRNVGAQTRGVAQHAATSMVLSQVGGAATAGRAMAAGKGAAATPPKPMPAPEPAKTTSPTVAARARPSSGERS